MNNEASSKIYKASYNFDFQSKNSPFLDEGVFLQSCGVFIHNLFLFKYPTETANRELNGSMVEYLTLDRGVPGSSLTGGTVLCS